MEEKCIQGIKQSKTFQSAGIYVKLIDYLYTEFRHGRVPKETSIAIDVFNRGDDFDPSSDTIVRVHMHNLRKKLEHYYLTEGKNEPCRLRIPKGHYQLQFIQDTRNNVKSL